MNHYRNSSRIKRFVRGLVQEWCPGNERYVNFKRVRKDIRRVLRNFDLRFIKDEMRVQELIYRIQDIINIVQPSYDVILVRDLVLADHPRTMEKQTDVDLRNFLYRRALQFGREMDDECTDSYIIFLR